MRWLAFVTLVVLATSVRADPSADRDAARREFALGQDDDRAGRFQAAIGHYLRANDVVPHPFNAYNIAVDYERLGNLRQAAEWYQRYLDAAPSSPDRDRVARTIADLKGRESPLSVRTIPGGADVTIDGAPAGTTPLVAKLPGGVHRVAVQLDAHHAEKDVELGYGEPADVAFALGGQAGTLSVGGAPIGAYVAVDNITIGEVPAHTQISAGPHAVRVTAAGYQPFETTAQVAPDAEVHVDAELVRVAPVAAATPAKPADAPSTVAFLAGAAAGPEIRGGGDYLALGMIGTRILRYDLVFRLGRAHGALAYDFVVRWQLFDGPITPFLAGGYSYESGGYGYLVLAGVRWDVIRQPHTLVSIVLDGGLRDAPVTDTTSTATSTVVDPIELGAEVTFR